ncbi:MAG: hypothetical protein JOZ69_04035 [Myxococcales bacterium]|nr:hypothetical protein [Myxococcales bacterium]
MRRRWLGLGLSLSALGAARAVGGCDAVPSLTFADGGSGPDGGTLGDGESADTAGDLPDATCVLPPGFTTCCGPVPCSGDCDAQCTQCLQCATMPGWVCCAGPPVMCHRPSFVCK